MQVINESLMQDLREIAACSQRYQKKRAAWVDAFGTEDEIRAKDEMSVAEGEVLGKAAVIAALMEAYGLVEKVS